MSRSQKFQPLSLLISTSSLAQQTFTEHEIPLQGPPFPSSLLYISELLVSQLLHTKYISTELSSYYLRSTHTQMGTSASSLCKSKGVNLSWKFTVSIIHYDGKLQQWKQPLKAKYVLSQNSNGFICSSDSMYIGSLLPHVSPSEELQVGQIYFLMPLSQSHIPLSLQELGALAIKAHAALTHSTKKYSYVLLQIVLHKPLFINE